VLLGADGARTAEAEQAQPPATACAMCHGAREAELARPPQKALLERDGVAAPDERGMAVPS